MLAKLAELLGLVAQRPLAGRLACLDRVRLEVVGEPAEVAVADERIFTQMTLGLQASAFKANGSAEVFARRRCVRAQPDPLGVVGPPSLQPAGD